MKPLLWIGILSSAACAGQPSHPTPTPKRYVSETGQALPAVSQGDLDEARLARAKKQGYTLVNKNGEELYCRTDLKTGSHLQKDTTCLTAQQLDALHDQTRQSMQSLRPQGPPSGK